MRADTLCRMRAALAAAVLVCAASCASIPPTNYYVLGLSREAGHTDGGSKFAYAVSIAAFESEPVYLRKKIIWRSESNRLGYYPYDRWAALPAEMFAFRLYERAHEANLFKSVHTDTPPGRADLIVKGKIISFEELDTPDGWFGKVEAMVELTDPEGAVIWSGVVNRTEPAAEQSVEAAVKAMAEATEAVITEILDSIEQSLEQRQLRREASGETDAQYFPP